MINEALVRRHVGGELAVGRRLRVEDGWRENIPYTQAPEDMLGQMLLKIRTATHPAPVVPLSRQELHAIAPTLAPVSIDMVGLYATFTQAVGRRTTEIGVRMAGGAGPQDIAVMVRRQVAMLAGVGLALGIPAHSASPVPRQAFSLASAPRMSRRSPCVRPALQPSR